MVLALLLQLVVASHTSPGLTEPSADLHKSYEITLIVDQVIDMASERIGLDPLPKGIHPGAPSLPFISDGSSCPQDVLDPDRRYLLLPSTFSHKNSASHRIGSDHTDFLQCNRTFFTREASCRYVVLAEMDVSSLPSHWHDVLSVDDQAEAKVEVLMWAAVPVDSSNLPLGPPFSEVVPLAVKQGDNEYLAAELKDTGFRSFVDQPTTFHMTSTICHYSLDFIPLPRVFVFESCTNIERCRETIFLAHRKALEKRLSDPPIGAGLRSDRSVGTKKLYMRRDYQPSLVIGKPVQETSAYIIDWESQAYSGGIEVGIEVTQYVLLATGINNPFLEPGAVQLAAYRLALDEAVYLSVGDTCDALNGSLVADPEGAVRNRVCRIEGAQDDRE